jgi:hypothetical protein
MFARRHDVFAGGRIRPLTAGRRFVGTSGSAGKQRVPDAGRREEGEPDDSDLAAHILFSPKIAPGNKKQHRLLITCVVSVGVLIKLTLETTISSLRYPFPKSLPSGKGLYVFHLELTSK